MGEPCQEVELWGNTKWGLPNDKMTEGLHNSFSFKDFDIRNSVYPKPSVKSDTYT